MNFKKWIIAIIFLILFETIGWFLYKNLMVDDIWKYAFSYIFGGLVGYFYKILMEE